MNAYPVIDPALLKLLIGAATPFVIIIAYVYTYHMLRWLIGLVWIVEEKAKLDTNEYDRMLDDPNYTKP